MNIIFSILRTPVRIYNFLAKRGLLSFIPDKLFLELTNYIKLRKKLNLKNPISFNEKIQWLKLYDHNPKYTMLVDKLGVREFISNNIGDKYLTPLLGVYDNFDDIDFNTLPKQFVLKCTHDSGGLVICTNKDNFNIQNARKKINKCLKRNYYKIWREWPYKNVKPRIICEKYMVDESGSELKDYKVFCFNGEPKLIQVDFNRFKGHKRNLYDIKWRYIPASIQHPTDPNNNIKQPQKLEEMLELARILSKGISHVRTDFYSIRDQIYFGEMTFYHGSGYEKFEPKSLEYKMGEWIKLP